MANNPQDLLKQLSTDDLKRYSGGDFHGMSTDGLKVIASLPQEDNSQNAGQNIAKGVGMAAVGGGAYGLYKGGKWLVDPFVQKMQLHNDRISPFMQKNGIPSGIPVSDVPKIINGRLADLTKQNVALSKDYKTNLQGFDNNVKNGTVRDIADNLSKNYPAWRRSAWEGYGNGLQNIENEISNTGVSFPSDSFNKNVIQKTADTLDSRGLSKEAENFRNYAGSREGNLVMPDGNPSTEPISFSNAKQAVTTLSNQNPKAALELKANWGSHLQNDPVLSQVPGINQKLTALNQSYMPFKQADNVAYSLVDPNTGGFDTKKLSNALHSYVKGQGNPQTTTFLKSLGDDSSLATPIQGLSSQADTLDALKGQRQQMNDVFQKTQVNNANNAVALSGARQKAIELASLSKGLDSQIGTRKAVIGTGMGLGGLEYGHGLLKAAGILGAAPQMLDVAQAYQTAKSRPDSNLLQGVNDMMYNSQTGNNLYQVQQAAQKALGYGNATDKDMQTLRDAGVSQSDLDKARKAFGVT